MMIEEGNRYSGCPETESCANRQYVLVQHDRYSADVPAMIGTQIRDGRSVGYSVQALRPVCHSEAHQ